MPGTGTSSSRRAAAWSASSPSAVGVAPLCDDVVVSSVGCDRRSLSCRSTSLGDTAACTATGGGAAGGGGGGLSWGSLAAAVASVFNSLFSHRRSCSLRPLLGDFEEVVVVVVVADDVEDVEVSDDEVDVAPLMWCP